MSNKRQRHTSRNERIQRGIPRQGRTPSYRQGCTHTHTHAQTGKNIYTHIDTTVRAHSHTPIFTHTHTHIHMQTLSCTVYTVRDGHVYTNNARTYTQCQGLTPAYSQRRISKHRHEPISTYRQERSTRKQSRTDFEIDNDGHLVLHTHKDEHLHTGMD